MTPLFVEASTPPSRPERRLNGRKWLVFRNVLKQNLGHLGVLHFFTLLLLFLRVAWGWGFEGMGLCGFVLPTLPSLSLPFARLDLSIVSLDLPAARPALAQLDRELSSPMFRRRESIQLRADGSAFLTASRPGEAKKMQACVRVFVEMSEAASSHLHDGLQRGPCSKFTLKVCQQARGLSCSYVHYLFSWRVI